MAALERVCIGNRPGTGGYRPFPGSCAIRTQGVSQRPGFAESLHLGRQVTFGIHITLVREIHAGFDGRRRV